MLEQWSKSHDWDYGICESRKTFRIRGVKEDLTCEKPLRICCEEHSKSDQHKDHTYVLEANALSNDGELDMGFRMSLTWIEE